MQTDYSETNSAYHDREMRIMLAQADAKRKDQHNDDLERLRYAMTDNLAHLVQSVDWLLAGHYGYAQHYQAWQTVNGRGNKAAALCQMVALWEYGVSEDRARRVWSKLTQEQQQVLNAAILAVIAGRQDAE